ncbi:hypothetical protein NDU88_002889 [Pleurodeles waltl]|uniref:Uncharacterized protein n=1 Tax=Pleurodeles waltl TaxID=8319 RepID=A0AAV7T3H4_PLEWA|nr:hypothetical protein NDU88_002889 [Pleurodeles waltl]
MAAVSERRLNGALVPGRKRRRNRVREGGRCGSVSEPERDDPSGQSQAVHRQNCDLQSCDGEKLSMA